MPALSVIVPAHNEEARIGRTLRDYAGAFPDGEIIVVLNGCSDDTAGAVRRAGVPSVRTLSIDAPVGKGGAVRAGFALATAQLIGYADADGATPGDELRRLFDSLSAHDAAIASRWSRGARLNPPQPVSRRIASRAFNLCVRALTGLPYSDTQCGAKAFRADALRRVLPFVETSNFAFDVDLLHQLRKRGARILELPIAWHDDAGSRVRLAPDAVRMLAALARLAMKSSVLRYAVPAFDRFFPTQPMAVHERFSVLVLGRRDARNPRADAQDRCLHDLARRWAALGHEVHWIASTFRGAAREESVDGVGVQRLAGEATLGLAAGWLYLRCLRERFDLVVERVDAVPFLSVLYSLKPKLYALRPGRGQLAYGWRLLCGDAPCIALDSSLDSSAAESLATFVAGRAVALVRRESEWALVGPSGSAAMVSSPMSSVE